MKFGRYSSRRSRKKKKKKKTRRSTIVPAPGHCFLPPSPIDANTSFVVVGEEIGAAPLAVVLDSLLLMLSCAIQGLEEGIVHSTKEGNRPTDRHRQRNTDRDRILSLELNREQQHHQQLGALRKCKPIISDILPLTTFVVVVVVVVAAAAAAAALG